MPVRIGVISVGGIGTRFKHPERQKCLTPIEGKPLIEHCIDAFAANGVTLIFLLTGHLHHQISEYLTERSKRGKDKDIVVAAVYGGLEGEIAALRRLKPFIGEDFLYTEGNIIYPTATVRSLIRQANKHKDSIAILSATPHVEIAPKHPRILFDRPTSRILSVVVTEDEIRSTPKARYARVGLYYFRAAAFSLFEHIASGRPPSELIKHALASNVSLTASLTKNPWFCLHTRQDLKQWSKSDMRQLLV